MVQQETPVAERGRAGLPRREFLKTAGKVTGTAALLGTSGLAAACGSSKPGGGAKNATISFWSIPWGAGPEWLAYTKRTTAAFEQQTGTTVEWTTLTGQSYIQKWSLAMSSGNPPDVGDMFYLQSRVLAGKGKWGPVDLTDRVEKGDFGDWDRFIPRAQLEAQYDDKIYAIPWGFSTVGFVTNTGLLSDAPATIEGLERVGPQVVATKQLKAASKTFGQPYGQIQSIAAMWGAKPLSEDLKSSAFNDPAWVDAMTWLQEMLPKKVLLKDAGLDMASALYDPFLRQEVACGFNSSAVLAMAKSSAPQIVDKLKSAPVPVGPSGVSTATGSATMFSVMESCKNKDAALEWIKFMTSPEQVSELVTMTGQDPADKEVQAKLENPYRKGFYDAAQNAFGLDYPTPAWTELTAQPAGPISNLEAAVFAGRDVKAALATAHRQTDEILSKYP